MIADRHDYFKNIPKGLKEESFNITNSNDFNSVREKVLYALKLSHTFTKEKFVSGATMNKGELDSNID